MFCLLSSKRPLYELLVPSLLDQRGVLETQFGGMTDQPFTYEMFEITRDLLIDTIRKGFSDQDRSFLLSFTQGDPVWAAYNFSKFPAVQWKLLNINKLKKSNPAKHKMQVEKLENALKL